MPLVLPAFAEHTDLETVLALADGIFLTGSPSNVHPDHFGQAVHNPALPLDPLRDGTTLPLIRAAMQRGIPIFAVCRGFQEINVALGGSLHQAVQDVPGKMDHREDREQELDEQYAAAHPVHLVSGGLLTEILGPEGESGSIMVNSLHGQGLDRLADGIVVEAVAPDGLVEAYTLLGVADFALAVQWHPEWKLADNPVSIKLFAAFGAACQRFHAAKNGMKEDEE